MKLRSARIRIHSAQGVRRTTWLGREMLVAPVTILVEGVHAGSGGPYLYTAEELSRSTHRWNGVPITVGHPREGGQPITANSPGVLEEYGIGHLYNVTFDSGDSPRLRGELYVDVARANEKDERIVPAIENGSPVEVSTGVRSGDDGQPGVWHDEQHQGTLTDIDGDHLAILMDETGACSYVDGCGIRANGDASNDPMFLLARELWRRSKSAALVADRWLANETSHEDIRDALRSYVDSLDRNGWMHYVDDVYDTFFIFCAIGSDAAGQPRAERTFKQAYTVDAQGAVKVQGDPVEVREVTTYEPVRGDTPAANARTNQEGKMDRKKVIDALIANGCACEDDRVGLNKLSDSLLNAMADGLAEDPADDADKSKGDKDKPAAQPADATPATAAAPAAPAAPVTPAAPTPAAQPAGDAPAQNAAAKQPTMDEFLANSVPENLRPIFRGMVDRDQKHREHLTNMLLANSACPYSKDKLLTMPVEELSGLIRMTGAQAPTEQQIDFTLANGSGPRENANRNGLAPAPPPLWPAAQER